MMSDIQNPQALTEAKVYEACRAFVAFAAAVPPERIVQGWQNHAALPAGTNEYAVVSVLSSRQHGTSVETFAAPNPDPAEPGRLTVQGLMELTVQIDFCSEDDDARRRADSLAVATRSSLGVSFFNDYGLSALYADDPRDISFVGDARQFVRRWLVTIHLCGGGDNHDSGPGLTVEAPFFDRAAVSRIENVDVHHQGEALDPQGEALDPGS